MSPTETSKPSLINKDANLSFVVELNEQISTISFSNSELSQDLILIAFPREIAVAQIDSQEPNEFKELIKFNHGVQCTALSLSPITTIYGVPKILVFCAAGNDFKLRIFESDLSKKDTTKVINAHSDYINDVAFDPDNNYLVSASDDNTAKLWSTDDYHCLYTFKLKSPGISCCWHKDDNSKLMLAEKMGIIRFYNVNTQKPILSVDCSKPITAAHWAPSDPQMVGCLQHGELVVWDLTRASRPLYTKLLFADSGNSIKFSPFGELVATMSQLEGSLKVTHVQTQHQRLSTQILLASNISWHIRLPLVCVGVDNSLMFWKGELKTVAPDPRWPQQNQTYACFTMFTDYHRCIRVLSEKNDACEYFRYCYERLCPNMWIDKWCEQIRDNTFPFPLPKPCNKKK